MIDEDFSLGGFLLGLRESQQPKMSREKLAQQVGVTATTIYRWERQGVEPEKKHIRILAKIFNVKEQAFYGATEGDEGTLNIVEKLSNIIVLQQREISRLKAEVLKSNGQMNSIDKQVSAQNVIGNEELQTVVLEFLKLSKDAKTIDILFSDIKPYLLNETEIFFKSYPYYLDLLGVRTEYNESRIRRRLKEHQDLYLELEQHQEQKSGFNKVLPMLLKALKGRDSF